MAGARVLLRWTWPRCVTTGPLSLCPSGAAVLRGLWMQGLLLSEPGSVWSCSARFWISVRVARSVCGCPFSVSAGVGPSGSSSQLMPCLGKRSFFFLKLSCLCLHSARSIRWFSPDLIGGSFSIFFDLSPPLPPGFHVSKLPGFNPIPSLFLYICPLLK